MAEPLEVLLAKIRRPRPRQQYQPMEQVGGENPGMRGGINPLDSQAISDRAQGVDISSVAPPTRLLSSRIDDDMYAGQTPTNLASTDDEAPNPFRTAAGSNARQGAAQQTGDCPGGVCPPPGRQMMTQQILSQPMMTQQLPEGVTLSPGEKYVEGSLRQGPPAAARPAQAMAAQSPVAQSQSSSEATIPNNNWMLNQPWMDPGKHFNRAEQQRSQAMSDLNSGAQTAAIGHMANRNFARESDQIGLATMTLAHNIRALELQNHWMTKGREDRLAAEHKKSPVGQAEEEAKVMSMPGASVDYRANQVIGLRVGHRKVLGVPEDPAELAKEKEIIEGVITAHDAVTNQIRYQTLVDNSPNATSKIKTAHAHLYDGLLSRYGGIQDHGARADKMSRELMPVYQQEYAEYYKAHPKLLGGNPTADDIDTAAHDTAITRVKTNIARVKDMVTTRQSPWATLTHDELMQAAGPQQAAPAQQDAPVNEDDAAAAGAWGSAPAHPPIGR